jgi:hypothetical protein
MLVVDHSYRKRRVKRITKVRADGIAPGYRLTRKLLEVL